MSKRTIHDLNEDDRPREKLSRSGAGNLTDAELLAILLGSGSMDESAIELAQHLLADCDNSLRSLGRLTQEQLQTYKGIGPAKAITILAACELSRRHAAETPLKRPVLDSADAIVNYLRPKLEDLTREECHALFLDNRLRLIKSFVVSKGGLDSSLVDVKLVVREALLCNATRLVFSHNHPAGTSRPSGNDDAITQKLAKAAAAMDLDLVDHIIVYHGGYYSYKQHNRII